MRKATNLIIFFLVYIMFFLKALYVQADDGSGMSIFGAQHGAATSTALGEITGSETLKEQGRELYEIAYYNESQTPMRCPTTEQLRSKYETGCWSCLVIGNLTEAFLGAADNGMGVTKKAGLVVLWVGTGIWLVFWGLKNVSSFTQIQLGNILNELLKFLFKVMLAYWVIIYSNNVLSQYLITPIMSVGSTIGQMFWHGDTKSFTTDYNSETEETDTGGVKYTTYEEIAKEIESSISDSGYPSIFPKSVMDSMLGAIASITYEMSDIMVLGNSVMCYAGLENGGAINIKAFNVTLMSMPNFFIWISGCIIWCLGFLLIWAVGYYFLDISFKIGFAVLAFPIVMGLWPFNMTQGKLFIIISIIAKSAALFAFLALMTGFGLSLFGESATVGGLDALFEKLDSITLGTATEEMEEQVNNEINDAIYLFSPIFVTMVFALIYFYKLVQQTSSDLVNKFFPDNAFGDSSPMHSTATMMTDYTRKMVTSITGANLAKDIVANQAGIGIKKLMQGTGRAIRHPQQTARNIASKFKGKSSGNGK